MQDSIHDDEDSASARVLEDFTSTFIRLWGLEQAKLSVKAVSRADAYGEAAELQKQVREQLPN